MKNKKWLKTFIASLLAVSAIGSMAACGKTEDASSGQNSASSGGGSSSVNEPITPWDESVSGALTLRVWEGGYGVKWLENVAAGFQQRYPNVSVDIKPTVERKTIFSEVAGGINTKYDIYFLDTNLRDYQDLLVDLSDVYESPAYGEEVAIGDKINSTFSRVYDGSKGAKIGIPAYTGTYGVVYNTEYISDFPVTTDGWKALCDEIKQDYGTAMYSLIFSGDTGVNYWHPVADTFVAQYLGLQAYDYMQVGRNAQGALDPTVSYDISQLYAAQAIEDLLWYENGYIDPLSTGYQYLQAQDEFMAFGSAAMMVNGSWMMTESDTVLDSVEFDFAMAKVPVLSAIIKHADCATIADDAELTALIKAIDKGDKSLSGNGYDVDQKAYDHVAEARNIAYASGEGSGAFVPKKVGAERNALAKLFLKYMYSEEGIIKFTQACNGAILPLKAEMQPDMSILPDFNPKAATFLESAYEIAMNSNLTIRRNGVAAITSFVYPSTAGCYEVMFGSTDASDRMRAQAGYDAKKTEWSANNYEKWYMEMQAKGLATVENPS